MPACRQCRTARARKQQVDRAVAGTSGIAAMAYAANSI